MANKKVQREKRTLMDGMERLTTKTKPTGARATRTNSFSLTILIPSLSPDTESHPRVATLLTWVDTSLSVLRDKVILHLVPKIPMTLPAVIELFFSV